MNDEHGNSEIHTIRLHGPWVAKVHAAFGGDSVVDVDQEFKVKVPLQWESFPVSDFRGQVAFRRSFNRPTGLEADQSVWLVVEQVDFEGKAYLNDHLLGDLTRSENLSPHLRVEVHKLLEPSNVLRLEAEIRSSQSGPLVGGARLEIQQ